MRDDADIPVTPRQRPLIARVLGSESFLEKIVLLVVTVLLSGWIVPVILKSADRAREKQDAISRAQAKLLEDFSETILTYETLALDVSWYGTPAAHNPDMQRKAFERYSERMVDLVARWRAEKARSQTLASPGVVARIDSFQLKMFQRQDTPINAQWVVCNTTCDWRQQHVQSEEMLGEANRLIAELAKDLGLAVESVQDRSK